MAARQALRHRPRCQDGKRTSSWRASPTAATTGRGEAVPYARYGETVEGTLHALRDLHGPLTRGRLPELLPAGAARNALDCALWDLEAKRAGKRAWDASRHPGPRAGDDLLHAEPRRSGADGRRRTRSAASEAAQAEARRRRRPRAHGRGPRRPARCAPRRRRQRGLDTGAAGAVSRCRRRCRHRADRAAAARRRRRGSCPHRARGVRVRR